MTMTARELEKKYGITVIRAPMDTECSETCVCGHHASEHYGEGTTGGCRGCTGNFREKLYALCGRNAVPFVHNFAPKKM